MPAERDCQCPHDPERRLRSASTRAAISSSRIHLTSWIGRRALYRHGGGELGFDLSIRIVEDSIDRLYPGGRLFLYTGTPVIDGIDTFFEAVRPRLDARNCKYSYEEIDPDVFGEELDSAPYDRVDRIAVVALTVHA